MKKIILIKVSKFDFRYSNVVKYKKKFKIVYSSDNKNYDKKKVVAIIAGLEEYSKKIINRYPNLRIISRFGTGTDKIDHEYANRKNILILRTKDEPVLPTAEFTISLILMINRKLYLNIRTLKNLKWLQNQGNNLNGKIIGIIGLGLIGKKVAKILKSFGCKIFYYDIKKIKSIKYKYSSLKNLFIKSDIICIHSNYTKDQSDLINKKSLKLLKKNCILINTARGDFVNENDLFNHMKKNKNFYAGFDCFKKEPYDGKLLKLENFFGTPHVSSNTYESRLQMSKKSFMNIINNL